MKIAISGASGFIGTHLSAYLQAKGHETIGLGRKIIDNEQKLTDILSDCQVVINLAGANINRRWTIKSKKEIYNSRIRVTSKLVRIINTLTQKPSVFISASAVGYYPDTGVFDESSTQKGKGFLSDVCGDWEKAAQKVDKDVRLVITRFGIVLSSDGGAFPRMFNLLRFKIATVVTSGKQMFPWIDLRDLMRAMEHIIRTPSINGIVNFVSPQRLTQYEVAKQVAHYRKCVVKIHIPRFIFKLIFGEGIDFISKGQTVIPDRLPKSGFTYLYPTINRFLLSPNKETVPEFDLERYMGKWYEIARFDHRFERGMINVTANYTLQPNNTIRVENKSMESVTGKKKIIVGKAVLSSQSSSKLKVSFFPGIYADYNVLEIDKEKYTYALIGSNSNRYLWILGRFPYLSDTDKLYLLKCAENRGYDISRFIWTPQSGLL